jgi:hypothetical protein
MKVPARNLMPSHSPSVGQPAGVGFVSGPRSVTSVLPFRRVNTISQLLIATEVKPPRLSLCEHQTRSTSGESE